MANGLHKRLVFKPSDVAVVAKIRGIAISDVDMNGLTNMQERDSTTLVNELQRILDVSRFGRAPFAVTSSEELSKFRSRAIRLLVKLSRYYAVFPTVFFVEGVMCEQKLDPAFRGGFADIFRGIVGGKLVAMKRLRMYEGEDERNRIQDMLRKEAIVWRQLEHPYILPLLGIDDKTFAPLCSIVSPWMQNGNLLDFIGKNASTTSSQINRWIGQAANGLEYLHEQKIVHGDLRAANVLIDDANEACLADFGLAHVLSAASTAASTDAHQSNARWLAPEMLSGDENVATTAGDVLALGRVCLEAYTLKIPFWYITREPAVVSTILRGQDVRRPTSEETPFRELSDRIWKILQLCWAKDPVDRLSVAEFIASWKSMTEEPSVLVYSTLQPYSDNQAARTHGHHIQPQEPVMGVYGQQVVPLSEPLYVGPTYDQEVAPYPVTVYQQEDFSFQPPLRSSFGHTYTDQFPDEEDSSMPPEQALILTTTAGPAQMSAELVSHYVQNVVKIQYPLADEGVYQVVQDAVNGSHLARDAVCKLAYLHQNAPSRRGLTWAEEQSANGLLTQTSEAVSQRGVFPDIGAALAALAMVSHVLFQGGRGRWREWLDIADACVSILLYEQRYSSPADCLAHCDALHRFVIMTTFWFDILASVTMSFPPRFLQEYRQLFDSGSVEGATVEAYCDMRKVMGVENQVMLALAEISALAPQVAQSRKPGRPYMAELVRKVYEIETRLFHRPHKAESPISPPSYPFDVRRRSEQERTDYSRQLTGDIFRSSARVYLAAALSGDSPQNADIAENVRETVSCLRRVPEEMKHQVVRMVVFGICICGCLTDEPEHQRFLYDLLDQEAKGEVGNCGEVMKVMQAVWAKRRANPAVTVDWRQEMARLGGPDTPMILLV